MTRLLLIPLLLLVSACAPQASQPNQAGQPIENNQEVFTFLSSPFELDLRQLGIRITAFETYSYRGSDPNVFLETTNTFYLNNPGFCPVENAFYAAADGLRFMTLASDGSMRIRGYLYDQRRRPGLTYAYFEGESASPLVRTVCQTVVQ